LGVVVSGEKSDDVASPPFGIKDVSCDGEGTTGSWGGDGLEINDAGRGERDVSHVASTSIFSFLSFSSFS
jgi:hypothetical protein